MKKKVFITGIAGFIGFHTSKYLLNKGYEVVGIDNFDDYYDANLKKARLQALRNTGDFIFEQISILDTESLAKFVEKQKFDALIHLAARPGVRLSMEEPHAYVETNLIGTLNVLEICRLNGIKHLALASTSSMYAGNKLPFTETMNVSKPISPYAASKCGAEEMAFTYHHLYDLNISVLRFFTVYGPMGRPDMSYFRFIEAGLKQGNIEIYGDGTQSRDFTYVEDIASGIVQSIELNSGYEIYNLGAGQGATSINAVLEIIRDKISKELNVEYLESFKADMDHTLCDNSKAKKLLKWQPKIDLKEGLERTFEWHQSI